MTPTAAPASTATAWRVDELARRAEISVDTIRFYQKRRLLPRPRRTGRVAWYGPDHLERLTRVRELQHQGLSLAVIGRLLAGELDATDASLAAAIAGASTGSTPAWYTAAELARHAGVPETILETLVHERLLVGHRRDGQIVFGARDAEIVRAGIRLLEAGLPLEDLLALARRQHDATTAIAETAVELFDDHIRRPLRDASMPEPEKAARLVDAFRLLLDTVTGLVARHFESVLLDVAEEHLEATDETDDRGAPRVEPLVTAPAADVDR